MLNKIDVNIDLSVYDKDNNLVEKELRDGIYPGTMNSNLKKAKMDTYLNIVESNGLLTGHYYTLTDVPKTVLFLGFRLDVDNGYVLYNPSRTEEDVVLFNLYDYFRNNTADFDVNNFKHYLEKFKVCAIKDIQEFFKRLYTAPVEVNSGSILRQIVSKDIDTSSDKGDESLYEFQYKILDIFKSADRYRYNLLKYRGIFSNMALDGITSIQPLLRTARSNSTMMIISNSLYDKVNLYNGPMSSLEVFSDLSYMPLDSVVSSKSERAFMGFVDLNIAVNGDDEPYIEHLSSSDNIKQYCKNTPYSSVLKGAVLSGVVRKASSLRDSIISLQKDMTVNQFNSKGTQHKFANILQGSTNMARSLTIMKQSLSVISKYI